MKTLLTVSAQNSSLVLSSKAQGLRLVSRAYSYAYSYYYCAHFPKPT
ncbi:MAG: hypothetical protein RRY95_05625 [Oscillospiraceae bacterium]